MGSDIFGSVGVEEWQLLLDKAPGHTAKVCKQYLRDACVKVIAYWPPNSPDINPIENVWGWMKARVYKQNMHTLAELHAAVDEAWEAVPAEMLTKLMLGMPERLRKVEEGAGDYIGM